MARRSGRARAAHVNSDCRTRMRTAVRVQSTTSASTRRPGRSAVSEPAAMRPGATLQQRAAIAQNEPRSEASRSGSGSAVKPSTCRHETTTRRMRARTAALRAGHSERDSRRPGRSAVREPAAARSGAAARQRAAIAQSELRSAASGSGCGAAVEPRASRAREQRLSRAGAHGSAAAEHNEREQTPTRPVGGERARRCAVMRGGAAANRARAERAAISGERERERRGGRAAHELRTRTTTVAHGRARQRGRRARRA